MHPMVHTGFSKWQLESCFEIDEEIDVDFFNALVPTLNEWNSENDEEAYNDL